MRHAWASALAQRMAPMAVDASPARRAQLTLDGLCDGWPALAGRWTTAPMRTSTHSPPKVVRMVAGRDDEQSAGFIIGHNRRSPTWPTPWRVTMGWPICRQRDTLNSLQIDRWRTYGKVVR